MNLALNRSMFCVCALKNIDNSSSTIILLMRNIIVWLHGRLSGWQSLIGDNTSLVCELSCDADNVIMTLYSFIHS